MEHGDEVAADVAGRLQTLADDAVRATGGRVVKLLGDGVLLRFNAAADAIRSVLRLVAEVEAAGLPRAHAGIAAGFVVIRDGDVYGQTVNLAARIAGQAGPGQVVVDEGAVIALPAGTAMFAPLGRVALKGIPGEVGLWLATPAPRPSVTSTRAAGADVSPAKEPSNEPGDRIDQDRRDERQRDLDGTEGKSVPRSTNRLAPGSHLCRRQWRDHRSLTTLDFSTFVALSPSAMLLLGCPRVRPRRLSTASRWNGIEQPPGGVRRLSSDRGRFGGYAPCSTW